MSSKRKVSESIARDGGKKNTGTSPTQLDRPPSVKPRPGEQISVTNVPRCLMPTEGILWGVAARNSSDAWAVGQGWDHPQMDMSRPLTMHWDGKCWTEHPCPNMGGGAALYGVCVVPPDGAFAVGHYADNNQKFPPLVPFAVSWDPNAKQWVPIIPNKILDTDYYISGVSGTSGSDVWLVGNTIPQWGGGASQTHVQHWNGNAWAVVPSPNVNAQLFNSLIGVAALKPTLAYAVGLGNGNETMVQRWNGKVWNVITSPNALDTRQLGWNYLGGVAAKSAENLCAVGTYTPEKPVCEALILESNVVDQWRFIPHPALANVQELDQHWLRGVALDPADGAWAVGNVTIAGNVNVSHPLVLHRDKGGPWTVMTDKPKGTAGGLAGVTAVTNTDVWAVGWYHDPNFKWPFCLLEHWDGNNWRSFP